jgi:hydroxymethylpyrimidine/phosphomethylpyrimidine kinase
MEDMRDAAVELHAFGPAYVLVKGGHLKGPRAVDILFDGREFREFSSNFVQTENTHGALPRPPLFFCLSLYIFFQFQYL